MIEIERVARPRPAPHADSGSGSDVFKSVSAELNSIAELAVSKQRISHCMLPIETTNIFGNVFLEYFLRGNALSRRCPHVSHVKIFGAIVVEVIPADTHACANVFYSSLGSNIGKGSIPIVAIKILSTEVIHHVEVGPAIMVVIAPAATKTVARIVLIQSGFRGHVTERSISIVAHNEVRRTVLGIMIGHWILVLIGALVIAVKTKINVQPSVAVIICDGRTGEGALGTVGESKRFGFLEKLPFPWLINKSGPLARTMTAS